MDPPASIDEEFGNLSDSDEERLLHSLSINESSPTDTVFHSTPADKTGDHAPFHRITENIVMCTPPGSPDAGGDNVPRQEELRLGLGLAEEEEEIVRRRLETSDGKSPVHETVSHGEEGVRIGCSSRRKVPRACKRRLPQGKGSVAMKPCASTRKPSEIESSEEAGCGLSASLASSSSKLAAKGTFLKPGNGESSGKVQEPSVPAQEGVSRSDVSKAHANSEAVGRVQPVIPDFLKFKYIKSGVRPCGPPLKILEDILAKSRPASEGFRGSTKLPPSIQSRGNGRHVGASTASGLPSTITEGQTSNAESVSRAHGPPVSNQDHVPEKNGNSVFPSNLLDVVKSFSAKPARTFEDVDILEVAAMKGVHFSPPKWWKPGGYSMQRTRNQTRNR